MNSRYIISIFRHYARSPLYIPTLEAMLSSISNILKASHLQEEDFGGGEIIQSLVVTINSMETQSVVEEVAFLFIYLGLDTRRQTLSCLQHNTPQKFTNKWNR